MTTTSAQDPQPGELPLQQLDRVVIRFAGDSGDGMQITGNQFTHTSALFGNDLATLPDFPAEIRAPAGTRPGVSGFQLQFSSKDIHTPGDAPDVLVAMNPAALMVNIGTLKPGGVIVVNTGAFRETDLKKAKCDTNPLEDGTLEGYRVIEVDINARVNEALAESPLSNKDKQRCKNFYTLGLMYWVYSRPLEPTLDWLEEKFAKPELVEANQLALKAGYNAGDIRELFQGQYEVPKAKLAPGTYRNIMGNEALAIGLVAGAKLANLKPVFCSYPITPASGVLEALAAYKNHGVVTIQSEDEIAAICSAIGASFSGTLGMTGTSGPGMALKGEAMGLAISTELPLVIVDVQRAGPSTGMPTKVEQSDLLEHLRPQRRRADAGHRDQQALRRLRHGHRGLPDRRPVHDPGHPAERQLHRQRRGALAASRSRRHGALRGRVHDREERGLPLLRPQREPRAAWVKPGTPGMEFRIGGLEKAPTSNISYDPDNHQAMTDLRHAKVRKVADSIPTPEVEGPRAASCSSSDGARPSASSSRPATASAPAARTSPACTSRTCGRCPTGSTRSSRSSTASSCRR